MRSRAGQTARGQQPTSPLPVGLHHKLTCHPLYACSRSGVRCEALAGQASARAPEPVLTRVAELANAWAQVSQRLPDDRIGTDIRFEQIISALKLALASLQLCPPRADGRTPSARAVQLASTLADLCAAGLPLQSESIAAGIVAEAVFLGCIDLNVVRSRLGTDIALLVHDILQVQDAPTRIEVYDDEASRLVLSLGLFSLFGAGWVTHAHACLGPQLSVCRVNMP